MLDLFILTFWQREDEEDCIFADPEEEDCIFADPEGEDCIFADPEAEDFILEWGEGCIFADNAKPTIFRRWSQIHCCFLQIRTIANPRNGITHDILATLYRSSGSCVTSAFRHRNASLENT